MKASRALDQELQRLQTRVDKIQLADQGATYLADIRLRIADEQQALHRLKTEQRQMGAKKFLREKEMSRVM